MAKRLFFVSATILVLAIAYHPGARNVEAQPAGQVVAMTWASGENALYVVTSDGLVYRYTGSISRTWNLDSRVFGGTIVVQPETWTGVKEKYRK